MSKGCLRKLTFSGGFYLKKLISHKMFNYLVILNNLLKHEEFLAITLSRFIVFLGLLNV
jgi:hypothetical protein